ncbi:ABC transporter substrate-binding protein [Cohnella luojiensis]|uniref:Sugar ABC transporter substrate-binding protein n=1 Tax=Cohnella luojiensis TaxID=652876 RepID=A0A4Y8LQH5_9BACL|nr:sugar ABC transporter substrate-binding protein [Cohnella luojiensis]TFE22807.1 sugar ABC transporter substrate-binding protein [Cohnella luojiensis]
MKRSRVLIMLLMIMTVVVSGCGNGNGNGNGSESSSDNSSEAGGKTKVTFMTWEGQDMNNKIVEAMKTFEEQNPDIDVELIPSPIDDYGTKINAMISAKEAPDIFMVGNDMAINLGSDGVLYDWKKETDADPDFISQFFPGSVEAYSKDGKQYGLPGLLNVYGIFYNKKAFTDAGIAEPKAGWTYTEMLEAAQKLSNKDKKQFGLFMDAYDPFVFSLYSVSAGGAPFADSITDVTKVEISPQFIEGVELFKKYAQSGAITPPDYKVDNVMGIFKAGQLPMARQGQWVADDLIRNASDSVDWGFAPYPVVNSETSTLDAVGWASPATIKNPAAVWKVLKYLDGEMYTKVLPETPVAPAAFQPAAKAYFDKLNSSGHEDLAKGVESMLNADKQPIRFLESFSGKANPFVDATFKKVIKGELETSALNDMADKINNVISKK